MGFETPEERKDKAIEASGKLGEIITNISSDVLEKAIRFMDPADREKLYGAVEISKTAKDPLMP